MAKHRRVQNAPDARVRQLHRVKKWVEGGRNRYKHTYVVYVSLVNSDARAQRMTAAIEGGNLLYTVALEVNCLSKTVDNTIADCA